MQPHHTTGDIFYSCVLRTFSPSRMVFILVKIIYFLSFVNKILLVGQRITNSYIFIYDRSKLVHLLMFNRPTVRANSDFEH